MNSVTLRSTTARRGTLLTLGWWAALITVAPAQDGPPTTPAIVAAAVASAPATAPGPVQPTWDSIRANYKVPDWFRDGNYLLNISPRGDGTIPENQQQVLAIGKWNVGNVTGVELLGHPGALPFTQDTTGLAVKLPSEKPSDYAYALKITTAIGR